MKPSIMLVEDSVDDSFFFQRALTKTGIDSELVVVEDGLQAMQLLSRSLPPNPIAPAPVVLFLDLKMPNANGFDVLRWLQGQPFQPPLRVVILTASDEPSDVALARQLGACEYYTKPLEADQLKGILSSVIRIPSAQHISDQAPAPRSR